MKKLILSMCFLVAAPSYAEFYKCTADGKTTYSDKPCVGKGGKIELKVAPANSGPTLTPEEASVALSEKERVQANEKLRKDSDNRMKTRTLTEDIERAENQLRLLASNMEKELAVLKDKKRSAKNNLAGATYEQSISTEMTAVTNSYSNKIEVKKVEIERLRREKDEISKK